MSKSYGLFDWDNYFKSVKETSSFKRITQFPASKTSHVVTTKESREGNKKDGSRSSKMYRYMGDSIIASNKKGVKRIPANAEHEKELKNASLHTTLDEILEKARPRASERKDPNRRKAEAVDDNIIIPDTKHVQTMSNPGPTEAEHYDRTKGGSVENLKRLAESKHPMDRKAAQAGMKRHE